MIDTIASFDGRIAKIVGAAQTGKTEALVRRAAALVAAEPEATILVEVQSTQAAHEFTDRLKAAMGADVPSRITVATPLDVCATVLATEKAQAQTGRVARVMNDAEYKFVLEDMKTLGQPIRRLRSMLDFFYTSMANLTVADNILEGSEEMVVYKHLLSHLKARGAMLAQECAGVCVEYLRGAGEAAEAAKYDYVLCDDFQNLSFAEQTCMGLLARKQFVVAGNENQASRPWYTTPFTEGFKDFENRRRNVEAFTLTECANEAAVVAFANGLCVQGSMNPEVAATTTGEATKDAVEIIKWNTPEEEFDGMTKLLRVAFDADPERLESETCILVPNKQWARATGKVLQQRGFAVSDALVSRGLPGDPRESARCKALVAYTKLNLLADEEDMVAWRSYCGFDNHLTNADAWDYLLGYATEHGMTLSEVLNALESVPESNMPFLRAAVLKERRIAGKAFIEKNKRRKGFDLLNAIGAGNLPEFAPLADSIDGDEDAKTLFALARAYFFSPSFPTNKRVLHIASPEYLGGTSYDEIYVLGAVNGYFPNRNAFEVVSTDEDRATSLDGDRRAFYSAIAKAKQRLVISYFSKADLELAEKSKMQVTRVRAEGEGRIALAAPSVFLREAGAACPGAVSGQTKLTELGLA